MRTYSKSLRGQQAQNSGIATASNAVLSLTNLLPPSVKLPYFPKVPTWSRLRQISPASQESQFELPLAHSNVYRRSHWRR